VPHLFPNHPDKNRCALICRESGVNILLNTIQRFFDARAGRAGKPARAVDVEASDFLSPIKDVDRDLLRGE
jgi:hypothetical protein